jgi:hypothetical protein
MFDLHHKKRQPQSYRRKRRCPSRKRGLLHNTHLDYGFGVRVGLGVRVPVMTRDAVGVGVDVGLGATVCVGSGVAVSKPG